MGCCGEREKLEDARAEQKWSYINLYDFTSTSCLSPLSYGILYIFLLISIAVYAVDCFTAANLLFFNRWSGQVKPVISFKIARWIFAACILFSLLLLVYRWIRALRVIRSGVVAASYLDPLAVRVQSIRPGARGQGWRRFLVFAALTEGRKGAEYVALFTYFSFEAWMRIVFAEGPRQLLNAQTLYSVMQADLVPAGDHAAKDGHSPIAQFWSNLQILASHNKEQAAILFGMLFTLIIWLFSVISLLLACIFYVTFLWHHIPDRDGSLARYCRRKIDTRLSKIVGVKVNRALAREDKLRSREAANANGRDRPPQVKRQPTIPIIDDNDPSSKPSILTRQTTQNTFSSGPLQYDAGTPVLSRQPTVPDAVATNDRPYGPSRSTTQSSAQSNDSYGSDAPLMGAAGRIGYGPSRNYSKPATLRSASNRSMPYSHPPISRKPTAGSQSTQQSYNTAYSSRPPPGRMTPGGPPRGPYRQNTDDSTWATPFPPQRSRSPGLLTHTQIPVQEYELRTQSPSSVLHGPNNGQYIAYNPNASSQLESRATTTPPLRNITAPNQPPPNDYFGPQPPPSYFPRRSGTAPLPPTRSGTAPLPPAVTYDDNIYDSYAQRPRPPPVPVRPATAGPQRGWNGGSRSLRRARDV
ncbi:MAG: hypothetical protein LQ338_006405 [Usnochroma carphineum]|nr:MAG: hypothetical protein LQ338_006405 [Usnochroma carphineum]